MARLIDQIKGHAEIWQRLMRDLQVGRLPHAMAFAGDSGVGKKKLAWALAQALVCTNEGEKPCGVCPACLRVASEQSESVLFVEPEKNTIKLESAERILQFLNLRLLGRARVVLIDQAHLLNPQTGNALLKVIEEPPQGTFFILIVNELGQLLPTLRSRVQVLRFSPLSETELQQASAGDWPKWKLRSARGSLQRLEAFTDEASDELRALTLQFLTRALSGQREGLDAMLDRTKDRGEALRALGFLQQVLRDWSVLGSSQLVNSDLENELKNLPDTPEEKRMQLWQRAFAMELDFHAHVDRSLLFENFFQLAQGAV